MIGAQTTFYGHEGTVVENAEKLINIFESIGMMPYIQIGPPPTDEILEDVAFGLNRLKQEHEVEYSVHQSIWLPSFNFFLNLGSSNLTVKNGTIDSLKKSINFAREIDAKNVSFHGGYAADIVVQNEKSKPLTPLGIISRVEAYSNVRQGIKKLRRYAGRDVKLSIENLPHRPALRYLFSTPEEFRRLFPSIGVLFDTGHAHLSATKTENHTFVERMVETTKGKITEIHASDNDGLEDQHNLPCYGEVPFSSMFRLISEKQKLPPVVVEAIEGGYSEVALKISIRLLSRLMEEF